MPLINTSVPNLIQGVSQQSDATRFTGQCEEQENALSSVSNGLMKRPNTRHIGRLLTTAINNKSFVHFINRTGDEKYVIIQDGTYLCAYNLLNGDEKSITVDGVEYISNNQNGKYPIAGTYLDTNTPNTSLKALTIADSTFILNKEQSVGLGTAKSPPIAREALIFIKQGDYKKKYGFKVEGKVSANAGQPVNIIVKGIRQSQFAHRLDEIRLADPANGGSGFSVGDIVDIELPPSRIVNVVGFNGQVVNTLTNDLTLYRQPSFIVTQTGTNGAITSLELENQGQFTYGGFGTGTPSNIGSYNQYNADMPITVGSTNSSEVTNQTTTNGFSGERFIESKKAQGNDASVIASNTLLTDLNSETGTNVSAFFDSDGTYVDNNLLILKSKQTPNGDDIVLDFSITPIDGLFGIGIGVVYKEVNSISDLPLVAKNGFEVKVAGDAEFNQDDYYVRFETNGGEEVGSGSWVECVAPELRLGYDSNTLPMELISELQGFTLRTMKFADRVAGDEESNPLASFVAQRIDNLFFFKNRLGFLNGENVTMSESGLGFVDTSGQLNFNFGRTTVTTLLDSDPIDISVASSRVTNLKSAKGFQENLVLFSENGQFVMKGGDILTPKTVSIIPVTNFDFDDKVDPLPLGSYIYFPFVRGNFTGVREFTVNSSTDTYDSNEVTEHVPSYIPKDVIDMSGTTSEDILALLSNEEKNALYMYSYFWNNNQKILSAWFKFTFSGEIRGIEFVNSDLYMVMVDNGETNLVKMPLGSGLKDLSGLITYLDMRVRAHAIASKFKFTGATGTCAQFNNLEYEFDFIFNQRKGYVSVPNNDNTQWLYSEGRWYLYDSSSGTTVNYAISAQDFAMCPFEANWSGTHLANATFTQVGSINKIYLPYTPATDSVEVYKHDGTKLTCSNIGNVVTLTETLPASTSVWVGLPYTMKYTFSEQLFKAKAGSSATVSNAAKMLIRNGSVYYDDTYKFDILVTPKGRPTVTESFDNGTTTEDGFFRFPVLASADDTTITIQNTTALPSNFQSAEFESFLHSRSSRYG